MWSSPQSPYFVRRDALRLIGVEIRTRNQREVYRETAKIPTLWRRVFTETLADMIPNRVAPDRLVAVHTRYERGGEGAYSVVVGEQVTSLITIPDTMVGLTVPAGGYLVFEARGAQPAAVVDAWRRAWEFFAVSADYRRVYTADVELYHSATEMEIFIAVEARSVVRGALVAGHIGVNGVVQ